MYRSHNLHALDRSLGKMGLDLSVLLLICHKSYSGLGKQVVECGGYIDQKHSEIHALWLWSECQMMRFIPVYIETQVNRYRSNHLGIGVDLVT